MERYRARVSGPLLDRIDLQVEVPVPTLRELRQDPGEPSLAVAARVAAARLVQQRRFAGRPLPVNGAMEAADLRRWCPLERLALSARGLARVLKVSRTIADLGGADRIAPTHVAEAIQYRTFDRPTLRDSALGRRVSG